MKRLEVGDVVRLRSGGPRMTVSVVRELGVTCLWFQGTKLKSSLTAPDTLKKLE